MGFPTRYEPSNWGSSSVVNGEDGKAGDDAGGAFMGG